MQFMTQNSSVDEISIGYNNMFISHTSNTKFLKSDVWLTVYHNSVWIRKTN